MAALRTGQPISEIIACPLPVLRAMLDIYDADRRAEAAEAARQHRR